MPAGRTRRGRRAEKPIDAPKLPASGVSSVAKSPKKPRRGGEHDPAVNTAAGAPSKGVSVDPAVNTAADAPSMGVSVDPAVNTAAGAPSKANNVAKQPRTCVGAECDIECVVGLTC